MRWGFWNADGFLGLAVVRLFAAVGQMTDLRRSVERRPYDAAVHKQLRALNETDAHPNSRPSAVCLKDWYAPATARSPRTR
jgi:hypothetical protein